jgi:bifunctional non-homologous end joining protein LigD
MRFIEPMLPLSTEKLPEGPDLQYEIKFDGYRALAMKREGKVQLRSRNDNDFNARYPGIVKALALMPDETVIDGAVVALDKDGRPSSNTLQNYGSAGAPLNFCIFDLLRLKGRDVMGEPLVKRRELLEEHVLPGLAEPIRYSPVLEAELEELIRSVKAQGLEGLVAKRRKSKYEPGQRSGAWQKMRVNRGQEFVIAGYTPSSKNFDALVIGYYEGSKLMYAARTRNGFTPASRALLFKMLKPLEISGCPFANLPEKKAGRWGAGLTTAKMAECRWLNRSSSGNLNLSNGLRTLTSGTVASLRSWTIRRRRTSKARDIDSMQAPRSPSPFLPPQSTD